MSFFSEEEERQEEEETAPKDAIPPQKDARNNTAKHKVFPHETTNSNLIVALCFSDFQFA